MTPNRAQEVLYESEAALRLVDHNLNELHEVQETLVAEVAAPAYVPGAGLSDVAIILDRANAQILAVLARLREGRAAIESTAVGKLRITHDKLKEVTSATEDAAINIMDACDRATQLVDELDTIDSEGDPDRAKAATVRGTLRDELFLMMGALQFQDITSQQLMHASAVLIEMERRMLEVARLFDPSIGLEVAKSHETPRANEAVAYDANATTLNPEGRQAVADQVFTAIKGAAA
jgi:hypothetical protein